MVAQSNVFHKRLATIPLRQFHYDFLFVRPPPLSRQLFRPYTHIIDCLLLGTNQIFAQILLTFRYGRDDEEVMGLKLSNESVLCVEQIYPLLPGARLPQPLTKCQVFKKSKLNRQMGKVGRSRFTILVKKK